MDFDPCFPLNRSGLNLSTGVVKRVAERVRID
jgi:hypothetical protein